MHWMLYDGKIKYGCWSNELKTVWKNYLADQRRTQTV